MICTPPDLYVTAFILPTLSSASVLLRSGEQVAGHSQICLLQKVSAPGLIQTGMSGFIGRDATCTIPVSCTASTTLWSMPKACNFASRIFDWNLLTVDSSDGLP